MTRTRILLLLAFVVLAAASFYVFDLGRWLDLGMLKAQHTRLVALQHDYPVQAALVYFAVYILVTGLSLPGAAIMTLLGGAIFGLLQGTVLAVLGATAGATIAFLVARFLLHDFVQQRFANRLNAINEGVRRDGAYYLFAIRLVPLFPFFIVNLVMALTPIDIRRFATASLLGMAPATAIFVNAGTQLAQVDSVGSILSPALVISLVLLAVFPLLARRVVNHLKMRTRLDP